MSVKMSRFLFIEYIILFQLVLGRTALNSPDECPSPSPCGTSGHCCPYAPELLVLDPSNTTLTFHCEIPQGSSTDHMSWCLMGNRMDLLSTPIDYRCKGERPDVRDCEVEFNLENDIFAVIPFVFCSVDQENNYCGKVSTTFPIRITYNSQEPSCLSCGYLIHVQGFTCAILPLPLNGWITYENNEVIPVKYQTIQTATYNCHTGFVLSGGNQTRKCTRTSSVLNGDWNGIPPQCVPITCPPLEAPNNGSLLHNCNDTFEIRNVTGAMGYRETVEFRCNPGFVLSSGETTRVCQSTDNGSIGEWTGRSPNCTRVTCSISNLSIPTNGNISIEPTTSGGLAEFNSTTTFSCDVGYRLVGASIKTCELDSLKEGGMWSNGSPFCKEITCSVLDPPRNGSINQSTSGRLPVFETVVTYSCDKGFTLVEENVTRACGVGRNYGIFGVWSGQEPRCERIQCSPLNSIQNGNVTYNVSGSDCDTTDPLPFGTVATYFCSEQYNITGGNATRTCHGNTSKGEWSGKTPSCNITSDVVTESPAVSVVAVGVVAGTIPPLAILSVVLGLLGLFCGYKMRSIRGGGNVTRDTLDLKGIRLDNGAIMSTVANGYTDGSTVTVNLDDK